MTELKTLGGGRGGGGEPKNNWSENCTFCFYIPI